MAYDEKLAERVRTAIGDRRGVTEKKMFGGVAFLLDGKMFCGVATEDLMVRVGVDASMTARKRAHVRPMDFTGRPLKGYLYVGPEGVKTVKAVSPWVELSVAFVKTVEATKKSPSRKPKRPARR